MRHEPLLVIYHGNCADGFGAAWAVNTWAIQVDVAVTYHPATHGDAPPDVRGRDVLLVDFSYPSAVMDVVARDATTLLILDHHVTAQEALQRLEEAVPDRWVSYYRGYGPRPPRPQALFDMKRSGAVLTWKFFRPGTVTPHLLQYVQDRDLWKFDMANSREVAAWYFSHGYNFPQWTDMREQLVTPGGLSMAVAEGEAILRKQRKDVLELLPVVRQSMVIGGHTVEVFNLPYTLASDGLHEALEQSGDCFAAAYFDTAEGRSFSLRSVGDFDTAEIAKGYGGGGHRNAAGFRAPIGWRGDRDGYPKGGDE